MGLVQLGLSLPFVGIVKWVQGIVEVAQKLSQLGLPRSRGDWHFVC